ncbi:MAG: TatD family hydrolase [Candidatus Sumerlaeaceae bacterium]|jgi:TatD DNase family protein
MKIVDTHAHLHDHEFRNDFEKVLERARINGVERIVLIGEDVANSADALAKAKNYPEWCWASVGLHPHRAKDFSPSTVEALKDLATSDPRVVAIGEIGLDFHYNFATPEEQVPVFRAQIELAHELRLPIVVHCREAYDVALGILREHASGAPAAPWGVMHCYFGTSEQAAAFFDLGLLLGIGGSVTFKKAEVVHDVVRKMPLDAMVLETDAPYMAPVPHRGKRNEPNYLPLVVERIAELKSTVAGCVAEATTYNAYRLFRWSS